MGTEQNRKKRIWGTAALVLTVSALVIGYIAVRIYNGYRQELIETEGKQLLTMAETIGQSLDSFISEEIAALDLYYSSPENALWKDEILEIDQMAKYFLEYKDGLYNSVVCYDQEGHQLFRYGHVAIDYAQIPQTEEAVICGKAISKDGWYEMYLSKHFHSKENAFTMVYSMNLGEIYQRIVAPVKIGEGGYSVVKDSSLAILMHHASDQIGLDALYDRSRRYPQLDLSDLFEWLNMQKSQKNGYRVIHTYVWDDPELPEVERIVAYTTIPIQTERWIVNATLPFEELNGPLRLMVFRLAGISGLFLLTVCLCVFIITRSLMRTEAQKREIQYLKELNQGMEVLQRKEEELRHYQRIQSVGQMSSHIAHEFNNYLTPIMVYGELLEGDGTLSEEQKEMIRGILTSAGQAAKLSRNLLDFSRQDTGNSLQSIELTGAVEEAASMIGHLAPESVQIVKELTKEPLYVKGREGMVEHILMNLCKNAFHAMEPDGGTLTIRLERLDGLKKDSCPQGSDSVIWARLTVSDTGCGIKPEALDKILEPFYTTKRSGKGTGLGLSVVRNLMQSVGGTIEIESELGKGTAFYLNFPTQGETEQEKKAVGKRTVQRIMVVDDDPQILKSIKSFLRKKGYQIECYEHPALAVARLQKQPDICDLILTDYSMPSMDGIELAGLVHSLNSQIPVILMSGAEDNRFDWYLNQGILDAFLLKSQLIQQLEQILDG